MKKVVLLSTSHDIQRGERLNPEYINHIKSLIEEYDIKSISEEIKDDKKYLAEKFCDEKEIPHKIIEPNDAVEKTELGIETLNDINKDMHIKYVMQENPIDPARLESWPEHSMIHTLPEDIQSAYYKRFNKHCRQREKIWQKKIAELDIYPSLVIFGADHLDEFSKLLESKGIEVVHQENFGIEE